MFEMNPAASEVRSGLPRTDCPCNANCGQVIGQPIFWLHRTIVLGCVSRQREAFGKLLGPNVVTETRRASLSLFIFLSFLLQELNAMPGVILTDLARDKSGADCWSWGRLLRHVIAPAVNSWLFNSSACRWGWPIAPDPTLMPRWGRLMSLLARCIRSLAIFQNRPHSSS